MSYKRALRAALIRLAATGVAAAVAVGLAAAPVAAQPVPPAATSQKPELPDASRIPPLDTKQGLSVQPEIPAGDFTVRDKPVRTGFVEGRSTVVERTPTADVYANPDGTRTAKSYSDVVNVRHPETGKLVPADPELEVRGGAVRPRLTAAGTQLPATTGPGEAIRVEAADGSGAVSLEPLGLARRTAELDLARATYYRVQPDVDLELRASTSGVKQTYLLRRPVATPTWTSRLRVEGDLTPSQDASGAITFTNRSGRAVLAVPAPVLFDSNVDPGSGEPRFGPVTQKLARDASGWLLVLAADAAWIADPARVFPVSVDPGTVRLTAGDAYVTDGAKNTNYNVWWDSVHGFYANKVGYYPGGAGNNLTYLWFDYAPWYGKVINDAELHTLWGWAYHHGTATSYTVQPIDCGWNVGTVTWNTAPCLDPNTRQGSGQEGYWTTVDVTDWVGYFANATWPYHGFAVSAAWNDINGWKKMVAAEQGAALAPALIVTYEDPNVAPPVPALTGPTDQAVVTTRQPALTVSPVTDPNGHAVQYEFTIATGADGRSGLVATSGWIAGTSWTVPAGVLKDGVSYTWTARARDVGPYETSLYAAARKLRVDLRLGTQGPVSGDRIGPITVNLATGNVLTSTSTPAMNTVGGPVSVTLNYNSHAVQETGLVGSYFAGDSTTGITDTESPVLVRTDPSVSFDWGVDSPYDPVVAKDGYRIRWQGYVTVPTTGSYVFGGVHDDGLRVWVNNQQLYDTWTTWMGRNDAPRFGTAITLQAGQSYPIRVEYREWAYEAFLHLWAKRGTDPAVPVPSSWLAPNASPLTPGWSLSADVDGVGSYVKAALTESGVTLTDATGGAHGYTKTSDGGYAPPAGEYGVLSRDGDGRLTLVDADGTTYEFTAAGDLASVTASTDARHPAAARLEWTPLSAANPISRLTRLVDPVSERAITLHYGTDPECGATGGWFDTPPAHRLCAVKLPDGSRTLLFYLNGKLARFLSQGNEITDYAYHENHTLWALRSPLALDWANVDPTNRDTGALFHQVAYHADGRVSLVHGPEPSGFDQSPSQQERHDYTYGADWTEIDIAGLNPPVGYARRITRDAAGRTLTDTDGTGRSTAFEWDASDLQLSVTDPAGRKSTMIYDARNNPTDTYGPAPAACFGADRRPLPSPPAGCDRIPHTVTAYDEGMTGFGGTWWPNATLTGAATGYSTTGLGNTAWNAAPPAGGLTVTGNYSGRLTGRVQVPTTGTYYFGSWEQDAADGVRIYVDDNLVADRSYPAAVLESGPVGYWRLGDATAPTAVDETGSGRNGTFSGSMTRGADGDGAGAMPDDRNSATDFTGGKVLLADANALDITGALTIEAWVKPRHNLADGGYHDLVSKYLSTDTDNLPYEFAIDPSFRLQLRQAGGGAVREYLTSVGAVTPYVWNHVAVTRTADNRITFYVNGAKSGEGTMGVAAGANTAQLALGRRPVGGSGQTWLDEVAIYDKALTERDISRHIGSAGRVNNGRQPIVLTAGSHRVRVDYTHRQLTGSQVRLAHGAHLSWRDPSTGTWSDVPAAALTPDYGLVTSNTEDESDGVPNQVNQVRYTDGGWDPAFGLATGGVANPGGLGLATVTSFEAAGTGFQRRTGRTMPSGVQSTTAYYGNTETRDNPCTPAADPVIQSGLERSTTLPTPASGAARVDEQVYDVLGRVVAEQVAGGGWICTTYDSRGRTASRSYPENAAGPARTVTYDHAFWTDPLVNAVTDAGGTTYTGTDVVGRLAYYVDVHGTKTEPTYDLAGRVVSEKVTPPNATDPPQTTTYTRDHAGRLLTVTLGSTTLATASYDTAGLLGSVAYANGSALSAVGRTPSGEVSSLTWALAGGAPTVVSAVTRTRSGRIVDESLGGVDARPAGQNYAYDAAGRLTAAWVAGHQYGYDLTSTASGSCPAGTRVNAGLHSNRVALTDITSGGTAVTSYCYDQADRLIATVGANPVTGTVHDVAGNLTAFTNAGTTTYLGWDAAGRNVTARATGVGPAELAYTRDGTDRIVRRHAVSGDTPTEVLYSHTAVGDNADLTLAADKRILTRAIALPGGVMYTARAAQTPVWDHPSVRGDLSLRTDNAGVQSGPLRTYTPFGDPLTTAGAVDPDGDPDTGPGAMDNGWLGQHQRPHEHAGALNLVQLGARPYSPLIGRFLAVDPVEGGSANDYDYTSADPINGRDLDGRGLWGKVKNAASAAGKYLSENKSVIKAGLGAAALFGCGVCGLAVAVWSAYDAVAAAKDGNWGKAAWEVAGVASFGVGRYLQHGVKLSQKAAGQWRSTMANSRTKSGSTYRRYTGRAQSAEARTRKLVRAGNANWWFGYGHYGISTMHDGRSWSTIGLRAV